MAKGALLTSCDPVRIELEHIRKEFSGNVVLEDVNLILSPGAVTGLLGGNATGKSTLVKIISGELKPSKGLMHVGDMVFSKLSYFRSRALGIATVYQDLALCLRLSILDNIFLGREWIKPHPPARWLSILDTSSMRREAHARLTKIGLEIEDLNRPVHHLSGGQRQGVAIARILDPAWSVLLLDEPTSALAEKVRDNFHGIVRDFAKFGKSILYISHDIDELRAVADELLVLHDGRVIPAGHLTEDRRRD